ncbi:MAG: hypothetical protein V5A62_12655 [Haloarculaceae archaeon]
MTAIDRVPSLSDTPFSDESFVGLWAAAAATYGAGDTLTTLAVLGVFASTTNVLLVAG